MHLADFEKEVQRMLLQHWTAREIEERLTEPEYFFEHVVIPRLNYLRQSGTDIPLLRVARTPKGDLRVILNH